MSEKNKPHVVVSASYFFPKIGGLENYAYQLGKTLMESGDFTVSVITGNYDGRGYKKENIGGMVIHRLPIWFHISNTPINPLWIFSVRKILKQEKPDIINVHSPVPFLPDVVAHATKTTPVVTTYHAGSMKKGVWFLDFIIGIYENIFLTALFRRSSAIITISQEFARKTYPQFSDRMHFIPTGVDLKRFIPTPFPLQKTITYVGRIELSSKWKGIDVLLDAFAIVSSKYPGVKLELVGGGDALPYYEKKAYELGIFTSVVFSRPLLDQKLVDAYARSSVVVLPSTSDSEAFSVVLVEAMASGRPIIGTRIGGTPQVIDDGENGLLVEAKNSDALAEAILRVIRDDDFAYKLAQNGCARAQGFSWDAQAKKYADIFRSLSIQ